MPKLKVTDRCVIKAIEYDEKYATGIFLATENKIAKRNCKILEIDLGEYTNPLELIQRMTKLEKTVILTTRILNEHFQYILQHYADKADFDLLLEDTPPESRAALTAAFNHTKMNTLGDIEFLGGALDSQN